MPHPPSRQRTGPTATSRRALAAVALVLALIGPGAAAHAQLTPTTTARGHAWATDPQIAGGAAGHAVAVWEADAGARSSVFAIAHAPGSPGWGGVSQLPVDPSASAAFEPQVVVDGSGRAIATWVTRTAGGRFRVDGSERPAGGPWGTRQGLTAESAGSPAPQLGIDATGRVTLVWWADGALRARERPAGRAWGDGATTIAGGGQVAQAFALDVAAGGRRALLLYDDALDQVRLATSAGGGWSTETVRRADGSATFRAVPSWPDVEIDDAGAVAVVWTRVDGTQGVLGAARRPGGGALRAHELARSERAPGAAHVALGAGGDAIAVWGANQAPDRTFASRFADGAWSHTAAGTAEWPVGGSDRRPAALAADPGGQVFLLEHAHGAGGELSRLASRGFTAPARIFEGDMNWSAMAFDPQGNGLLIGARDTGTAADVLVRADDRAAPLLGRPDLPGPLRPGAVGRFGVTALDAWSATAVRWSFGDGGAPLAGAAVERAFAGPGTFRGAVTASDAHGRSSTRAFAQTVAVPSPVPDPRAGGDAAAPMVTLGALPVDGYRARRLRRGLAVRVRVSAPAALRAELVLRRRAAKRLGVRRGRIAVGRVRDAAAGAHRVRMAPRRRGRRALARIGSARLPVTLRVTATDAVGMTGTTSRGITLRP